MKKHLFFAATALAMLASCSQSDDLSAPVVAENTQPQAIEFGTYVGKNVNTRAIANAVDGGVTGSITSAQALAQHRGFGVFAYYTEEKDYLGTTSAAPTTPPSAPALTSPQASAMAPNFMYNQRIEGTDAATPTWSYSPVKYWPNDNTVADDQDDNNGTDPATGTTNKGKLSFFAYAPYVATVGSTGVIAMSASNAPGNPTITYKMQAGAANPVDLLWGTAGTNGVKAQNGDVANSGNYIAVDPSGSPKWADRPFAVNANLTKMKVQGKVQFVFKHALAKVGGSNVTTTPVSTNGLQVMLDVDDGSAEKGGTYDNATTKVTVSDITITARAKVNTDATPGPDKYLTPAGNQGTLDLATGQWTIDVATASNVTDEKASASSVTHQITTSGDSPANASLNTSIAEPATLASGTAAWDGLVNGVLTTPKNVYENEANPLVYIPGTYPELDVQITYITRTKDANLAKGYSEVPQTVKKTLTFTEPVQLNKQYNLIIRLGLTSVKFDATVSDWDPDTNNDGSINESDMKEIYLPINVSD